MLKEHKKLYKAGKKWLTATITVASFALLSAVNDQKAQADTTNTQTDNQQISTTTVNNHVNQNTNKVSLNGSQVSQNNSKTQFSQSSVSNTPNTEVQNNSVKSIDQTNNTNNQNATPQVVTTAKDAASSVSDGLDPTIYGTVNVKDWDYQENNNILDLTDYHGKDTQHVVVPNLNDFNNAGINIKGDIGVGVTSNVLNTALCRTKDPNNAYSTLAISKTKGNFSDKVIAENGNWQAAFDSKKIVSTDDPEVKGHIGLSKENYFQLTHVDLSNLITTKITDMSYMFNWQRHLIDINGLSNWDTSNVTNMSYMFAGPLLKNVDVGNWDTSNVTNMSGMFDGTQISDFSDIKNWNTSNVVNMSEMFRADDYLTSLDLNNWDTSNVTDMSGMFDDDTQLIHLNVSNWNTSKVTNMSNLFAATALTTLDVNNWDTSNVTDMSGMFFLCKRLTNLDLNNWNTSSLTNIDYMFDDTPLSFFTVSNNNNQFKNQIKLTDPNGLMGERGATVTFINTPTFYRKMDGKTEAESVYETVVPLVKQQADKIYQQFRDRLAPGMKLIYPSEVTLKMDYPSSISDPSQVANAEFSYDSKIGTLKDAVINYVDPDGEIIQSDQLKGVIGSTVPISINLPKGYELADPNETIPTSITLKKGKLQIITINVKKSSAVSETKTGSINYVDQNGNVIKTDQISGQVGSTVAIHVSLPDGYELADPNETIPTSVTVTKDGISTITVAVKKINTNLANNQVPYDSTTQNNQFSSNHGWLDSYRLTKNFQGQVQIVASGWHVSGASNDDPYRYMIVYDNTLGHEIALQKIIPVVRPDVHAVYPNVDNSYYSGFNVTIIIPNADINHSLSLISRYSNDPNNGKGNLIDYSFGPFGTNETKTGLINYVDQSGKVIKTGQISGQVGSTVTIHVSLPDGYELADPNETIPSSVNVTKDGIQTVTVAVKKINTNLANNQVPYDSTTKDNQFSSNHGWLDSYKLTETPQGQAQIIASGWHVSGASNSVPYRYMIVYDNTLGHEIARQKLTPQIRNDVQNAYQNVNNSRYSGFNITISIPDYAINHSLSLISRYSNDSNNGEGLRADYWFGPLTINESNQAYLDNVTTDNNVLTVTGWHATNQVAGRPYHYIIVWDQTLGHEIARQLATTVSRPDVANVYNTIANATNSGFKASFNMTPSFFNDNIQFISRWTNDPLGNGNAVDYWFKPMSRINRANLDSVNFSSGKLQVAGWHADDISQLEPNHYLIVFDNTTGQQVASEKVALEDSADVARVFNDTKTANHSRFNYTFNSLNLIPGHHYSLVSRYSADANGNGNDGAHTDYWLNMGTFHQAAHYIDSSVVKGNQLTLQGWMANDQSLTKHYPYAILLQNGKEIGRQQLTLTERDDVARAYPKIYRSQYSGFKANFTLPSYSIKNLQIVLRFTDDPAGNGNSSDDWIWINPVRV